MNLRQWIPTDRVEIFKWSFEITYCPDGYMITFDWHGRHHRVSLSEFRAFLAREPQLQELFPEAFIEKMCQDAREIYEHARECQLADLHSRASILRSNLLDIEQQIEKLQK